MVSKPTSSAFRPFFDRPFFDQSFSRFADFRALRSGHVAARMTACTSSGKCSLSWRRRVHRRCSYFHRRYVGIWAGAQGRAVGRALGHGPALPQSHPQQLAAAAHLRSADAPGRKPGGHTGPRAVLAQRRRHHLGIQAAAGRQVHRRLRLHRQRRHLFVLPRAAGGELAVVVRDLLARRRRHDRARPADAGGEDRGALSGAAERSLDHLYPLREGERRRRGDVRPAGMQGDRHLPQDRSVQRRYGDDRHRAPTSSRASPRATVSSWSATRATGARSRSGSA